MASSSDRRITIGIECESLEGDSWGVARMVRQLVTELAARPELRRRLRFALYFRRAVPADMAGLDPDVFSMRVIGVPSFSFYYFVALPLRLWFDRPAVMFWPNYMLPIIHPPYVKSLVMLTEDIYREMRNPRLGLRYRLAYRIFAAGWAAHMATRIMAISRASAAALRRIGLHANRLVVNELGVRPARAAPADPGTYLLYVGQAFERRHLRESLAAFTELAMEDPILQFRIIGPDRYDPPMIADAVRHLNHRLGRSAVSWRPQVGDDELAMAYRGARAVVYVSDEEAFGLPPIEALAYGTPAVIMDAPVTREVFGDHAFFTPSADVGTLTATFRRALGDREARARIKDAAPSILARHSWAGFADRFITVVRALTR